MFKSFYPIFEIWTNKRMQKLIHLIACSRLEKTKSSEKQYLSTVKDGRAFKRQVANIMEINQTMFIKFKVFLDSY